MTARPYTNYTARKLKSTGGTKPQPAGSKGSLTEKVGFPGASLPGPASKDRSAGVKKLKQYPDSKGL